VRSALTKAKSQTRGIPTIEDNVILYAGSTILGGDTVIGKEQHHRRKCLADREHCSIFCVYHKARSL
jgi:serine O-acetyltransferase